MVSLYSYFLCWYFSQDVKRLFPLKQYELDTSDLSLVRFSVLGVSNVKSIDFMRNFVRQLYKFQNDILELEVTSRELTTRN